MPKTAAVREAITHGVVGKMPRASPDGGRSTSILGSMGAGGVDDGVDANSDPEIRGPQRPQVRGADSQPIRIGYQRCWVVDIHDGARLPWD